MQIDVLRPISVRGVGEGTAVPSGTLATVTSDDNDATYIDFDYTSSGGNWNLRVGPHTPPANHERHQVRGRVRIRCDAGTINEDIDLGRGTEDYIDYDTISTTSSFQDLAGDWYQDSAYGLATAGALSDLNIGGGYLGNPAGGATETRTAECYVDVDCRFKPDFAPEVRDAAGVDQAGGTVTDTNQPSLYFGGVSYDGLPPLDWRVRLNGATIASGSGTPPTSVPVTDGLGDGSYVAEFRVRSTIRGSDPFENTESLSFDVENIVPPPSPPIMSVVESGGGYLVSWENPGGQPWDNDYVVAELWRLDCTGNQRIATIPDGLNGSYLDLAIPQLDPLPGGVDCEVSSEPCDITYSVRYWGYVSTFVELPDTIPADLILAWPGTVGTIPSGWTRVTTMDGFYPVGSNGTGVPVASGGSATHDHTTPGHTHQVAAHSHPVGGSTGTSNASTTSARFNGASQPQADQPHSHALPSSSGSHGAQNAGNAAPDTDTADNLPATRTVIWIESDGSQAQYPVGVLGWATEDVSGWESDANSTGRFLRGAPAAGDGGVNSGAATHTHAVDAHTHSGFSHDHSLAATGLSNPSSSQEAGTGASTPRWLPRHTHPTNIIAISSGTLNSAGGGTTGAGDMEPPNRRLRTLINTGGGTQTRIIGLYLGTVAALDPLLTLCDGNNGTPDMRTWFVRDVGADSVNSTGGGSVHSHTTPSHTHTAPAHDHSIDVLTSATGSFEAPTSGDLGSSPTTSHDHTGGTTDNVTPGVSGAASGTTDSVSHAPPYHDAHFVRLDGTISGGPLPVPELRVTEYASATVPSFTYADGLDRLATLDDKIEIGATRSHDFPRLVTDSIPLDGGLHSVSTTLAGEDMTLVIATEGLPAIDELEGVLSADRVYHSPLGGTPGWYAPAGWTVQAPVPGVKVLTVTMVRQPWPTTSDPSEFL